MSLARLLANGDNAHMTTDEASRFQALADLKEAARQAMAGAQRDPELVRRIQERARAAREEVRKKLGTQEIGVKIIREMRDAQ
jgi:hypothetical protein